MATTHSIKAIKKFHEVINEYIEYALNRIDFSYFNYTRNIDPHDNNYEEDYRDELKEEIFNVLFNGDRPDLFNHNFSWYLHHHSNYKPSALAYHAIIYSVKVIINEFEVYPQEVLCDIIMENQSATMNKLAYFYQRYIETNTDKLNQVVNDMFMDLEDKCRTTGKECVVCYDDCIIAHICQTCKHSMVCKQCYPNLNNRCPLCRNPMVMTSIQRNSIIENALHQFSRDKPMISSIFTGAFHRTMGRIERFDINTLKRVNKNRTIPLYLDMNAMRGNFDASYKYENYVKEEHISTDDINFMMHSENLVIVKYWNSEFMSDIQKEKRLTNKLWRDLILEHTEIKWEKYMIYVRQGLGEDWVLGEY